MSSEIIVQVDQNLPNDSENLKSALLKNRAMLGVRIDEDGVSLEHIEGDKWKIIFADTQRRGIEFLLFRSEEFNIIESD